MWTRRLLIVLVLCAATLSAQERVDVTAPIVKTITNWKVTVFNARPEEGIIFVEVMANTGETRSKIYSPTTTPSGPTLISNLNTANLTTRSLYQRILDRLIADGVIEGTVAGTPR